MTAKSEIEKLQEAVGRRLLLAGDFETANIYLESAKPGNLKSGNSACGVKITVRVPMPQSASKYAAGPVFSKVDLQILIERDDAVAKHTPSIASIAESVTLALHNWTAPADCGYGKVRISEQHPWQRVENKNMQTSAMLVNFSTQSVLG